MQSFLRVHDSKIKGILSGLDRVRFRGTLRLIANTNGMLKFLCYMRILLKDFLSWSSEVTETIRRSTEQLAAERNRPVIYLYSCHTDKEATALRIAQEDNITQGLICVLTCVESCQTFTIRKDATQKKLVLTPFAGRCLHQYFYLQHPEFGLMQIRLQTWAPFTIYINLNGREWLAGQLQREGIAYEKRENCFTDLADVARAQSLMDEQLRTNWNQVLGELIGEYHPTHAAMKTLENEHYYWSAEETEWATDVMFRSASELSKLYPRLVRHSVTDMGCQNILRYLGRTGTLAQCRSTEITTSVLTRHEETRCKHVINGNSVKMYDKQESVLRIETTINNPHGMSVFRTNESKPNDPPRWRRLRKGVADLHRRAALSQASNERYLADLASVDHTDSLIQSLEDVCRPITANGRRARALNPFHFEDARLLDAIHQGEFCLMGFRNRDLKQKLFGQKAQASTTKLGKRQSAQVTRQIRLLRSHQLIRKVQGTHRYVLTEKGRMAITAIAAAQNASTKRLAELAV
jgi:hypothetical protein